MKKILSIILTITMLCSVTIAAFADGAADGAVKVGINAEYEPFEYYQDGELKGFDIELMNLIGEKIGRKIEFVNMDFDMLLPAVASEKVDCAISAITVTKEREKVIDFSRKYLRTTIVTFENGQTVRKSGGDYAIVFRSGVSKARDKSDTLTDYEKLYIDIDNALSELAKNGTAGNLLEKYELNQPMDETKENIEYGILNGVRSCCATIPKTSAGLGSASKWAEDSIKTAREINIISGDYNFPKAITRGEFCELAFNYVKNFYKESLSDAAVKSPFTDTDNEHIAVLNALDIIKGKSETEFAPNDFLTREEAAAILYRLIKKIYPDSAATEMYFEFADSNQISDWAMSDIQVICNMGIMKGVDNNKFAPKEFYTTEQAVATLVRVYENAEKSEINDTADLSFSDKLNAQMPADKNYMFSPLSVKMALSLAANGAEGDTKNEILNALGIKSLDEFNALSKDLIKRYSQSDILSLNIANSIWINKDKTTQNFSNAFKDIAAEYYNADVKAVDNKNAVGEINSWVNDKTNGKIPKIINNADNFWAMLINAIYFKGAWQSEFNDRLTKPDEFTNADGTKTETDFMNKTSWIQYAKTKSAKIIELPYKNRTANFSESGEYIGTDSYDDLDISMYLLLSDDDINAERELDDAIESESFKGTYIELSMPKFKIEYSESLNDMLKNIGIKTAFDTKAAQFGKMFDSGNMWFTDTIHKTFISVDEKGTEAAAVTGIGMAGSSLPPEPIELKFDTPFYFVIRDNISGESLFMGRYAFAK